MFPNDKKQKVASELRQILELGYELQERRGAYKTPYIPKSDEPNFKSQKASFGEYVHQNWGLNEYLEWQARVEESFTNNRLSFRRFRNKTETFDPTKESTSRAAILKRQLSELDRIVHEPAYFDTYVLTPTHAEVDFRDGVINQGYQNHKFKNDPHAQLLSLLWEGRRIESADGKIMKRENPQTRSSIYKSLQIDHERFKDIVRAIHIEMKRKSIALRIKFPHRVYIVVTQDAM